MAETVVDLEPLYIGCSYAHQFVFTDEETGSPIDLTGYTAMMKVKSVYPVQKDVLEMTTENGRIIITGGLGLVELVLSSEDSAGIDGDCRAVYDLILRRGENVRAFVGGNMEIRETITYG